MRTPDAIVVGSGPNGLAAALTLAREGLAVDVFEGRETPGGGCRTEALTLPGCMHDVCSAVHPLLAESPFFRGVDLRARGVELLTPKIAFAHPLDGGRAGAVSMSVEETASRLGADSSAYRRMFSPLLRHSEAIVTTLLSPLRSIPSHPFALARFGLQGLASATSVAKHFKTEEARGIFAGAAAHSMLELDRTLTGSFGMLFTSMAHSSGWPLVRGGSSKITTSLVDEFESHGGRIITGHWIRKLDELPKSRLVMLDVSPRSLLGLAEKLLPARYRRSLQRYVYGPGVFKVDWALSGTVPWDSPQCREAGTLHLGGNFEEIARSESDVARGRHSERPFCLVVQPGVVDRSRAPEGFTTLWGYCHVPSGSTVDMTERVESQIERFAPGFRELVVARATRTAAETEAHNPNCVGGDVGGGLATLRQTIFRPNFRWNNYRTPIEGVYLCSASTPPGAGVHGMCGYNAAKSALRHMRVHG